MQKDIVPIESVTQSIHTVRGQRVILDADLADLYGVETRILVRAVKRNLERFPSDFMFVLTPQELTILRSQIGISRSTTWGGRRTLPFAFTEQGVAMLSSVLNSPRAVQVNIEIMRAFIRFRQMLVSHDELVRRMDALEAKYDKQFAVVFQAIRHLMAPPEPKHKPIGFTKPDR